MADMDIHGRPRGSEWFELEEYLRSPECDFTVYKQFNLSPLH